ncbi:thiolase family protein [Dactylosporangium sp. NPDC050688]|uniref:thiolase family protein n=1 Tax=Dactylosporangium sp. NPDC050688 TaxID=3157217 RepID=UPI0033DB9C16
MAEAYLIDAVRTPSGRGKAGGALSGIHPADLLAATLRGLLERTGVAPELIDDVIGGCVTQAGEQAMNITRQAVLAAGFPHTVPATTVDRQCGSSQQAVHFAAHAVAAGAQDLVVACGVESMSRAPMWSNWLDRDPYGPGIAARYPEGLVKQGIAAELVADRWSISRSEMDEYAARSHQRAAEAADNGWFAHELLPITDPAGRRVDRDETVRPGTTVEDLAGLRPAFRDESAGEHFPGLAFQITAGNSSPLTDGASAVLVASAEAIRRYGLSPLARVHRTAVAGADPTLMLTAVLPATAQVLTRAGLTIHDMDAVEVNEAFACVPLMWQREFAFPAERLNRHGGAIALGHPLGSSGTRLLTTLLSTLTRTGGRYGLQTMCEAGGMANALIIERL